MINAKLLSACGLLLGLASVPTVLTHTDDAHAETQSTTTVTFRIEGMVTPSCPMLLERAVRAIEGVITVQADHEAKTARVGYRPGVTSARAIARVIKEQTGFDARIVPADDGARSGASSEAKQATCMASSSLE